MDAGDGATVDGTAASVPAERKRVLTLLLERVEFDATEGEVAITFRPGAPRGLTR